MAMLSSSPVLKFIDEKGFDERIVTDIAYDYCGRRLATVSADAVIKIRDLDDAGVWCVEDGCEIKSAHQGTLWKVDWAHPRFGKQLIATCSQDRTVKIWEENSEAAPGNERGSSAGWLPKGVPRWMGVATLTDSKYGVVDVKFAPPHLGLRLASASEDGDVRVYKVADLSSASAWKLESSFTPCPEEEGGPRGVTCISWCSSPFLKPLIVVGTKSGSVQIWLSTLAGEATGKWTEVPVELPGHRSLGVSSVHWSPQFCTSYDRIATCGGDGRLQVHRLERQGLTTEAWDDDVQTVQVRDDKGETEGLAWSAEFDANGCSLSSTDGKTCRIWMPDSEGIWFCTDIFQEVGVRGGGGSGDKKLVKASRQEETASGSALAASTAGAPLQTTAAPEIFGD
eukprot:g7717.t1